MSDDLVKHSIEDLQEIVRCHCHPAYTDRKLHNSACLYYIAASVKIVADRIEELEAVNKALSDKVRKLTTLLDDQFGTPCEQIRHTQKVEELEAKLVKAVEALEGVRTFVRDLAPYADQGHTLVPALEKACTTLAELKGEKT